MVDAAHQAAIPRIVQESVVMIHSDGGADWIDENHP